MVSEVYDTPEGRTEINGLISILNTRIKLLEKERDPFGRILDYYCNKVKEVKNILRTGADRTSEGAAELETLNAIRKVAAYHIKELALEGYVPKKNSIVEDMKELEEAVTPNEKSGLFRVIEWGTDIHNIPYREIICPASESAVIKKFDVTSEWECEIYNPESRKCRICKYSPFTEIESTDEPSE